MTTDRLQLYAVESNNHARCREVVVSLTVRLGGARNRPGNWSVRSLRHPAHPADLVAGIGELSPVQRRLDFDHPVYAFIGDDPKPVEARERRCPAIDQNDVGLWRDIAVR